MKFKDGKTFSAYVRSKLHSSYITFIQDICDMGNKCEQMLDLRICVICVL